MILYNACMKLRDIGFMLAKPSPAFSRAGWFFELKFDGIRAITDKQQILSRNHDDLISRFPSIAKALKQLPAQCVLDGEVCALDDKGVPDFGALLSRSREHLLAFFAFDVLFLDGVDLRSRPYAERKAQLRSIIPAEHLALRYVEPLEQEGETLYQYALSLGMGGVVAKKDDAPCVAGRNNYWLKFKPKGYHDGFKRPMRRRVKE